MTEKKKNTGIMLKNVRLNYPCLFKYEEYKGVSQEKYGAIFLISKDDQKNVSLITNEIKKYLSNNNIPSDRICLRDGDEKEPKEYHNHYYVHARTTRRPTLLTPDRQPIIKEDDPFYSGCYVNALINIYQTKDKQRICAGLQGVQFYKDGESFAGVIDFTDQFETEEPAVVGMASMPW